MPHPLILVDNQATELLGATLAQCLLRHQHTIATSGAVVWLQGDLGAGKTTLVRGFMHAMGHQGAVKSPTYTLVEPYQQQGWDLYHFDLYRLGDAEELEYLGIRDYFGARMFSLIEWPQRGQGVLPAPDMAIMLDYSGNARAAMLEPLSDLGAVMADCVRQIFP